MSIEDLIVIVEQAYEKDGGYDGFWVDVKCHRCTLFDIISSKDGTINIIELDSNYYISLHKYENTSLHKYENTSFSTNLPDFGQFKRFIARFRDDCKYCDL